MKVFLIIFALFPNLLIACPGCAGSMSNQADNYTVYILWDSLSQFIFHFIYCYKLFFKYKDINKIEE